MIDSFLDLRWGWKVLILVATALTLWVGIAMIANATGTYGDPKPAESGPVASTDTFDTYVTHVEVDGRTIPCVSSRSKEGMSISCDWSTK